MKPVMAKLIYSSTASLDGYVADEDGNFDWADPDEEVDTFVNDLERPVGTYRLRRRMYEVLVGWETMDTADHPPLHPGLRRDLGGRPTGSCTPPTLEEVSSAKTRIERDFDPDGVRNEPERGGLFAAFEQLELFVDEVRAFRRPLSHPSCVRVSSP